MTTGANKDDFHLRGVAPERDIQIDKWADLRAVQAGEMSPDGAGVLEIYKSLEVGHIFKLGTKYSEAMGAKVLDENGKAVPVVMGSYGIGVERILAAVIEQNNDEDGIIWTRETAPFDVVVTVTNIKQPELFETGEKIYNNLRAHNFDVLLDDRDERAGVKFKDADLIGIPFRITVGKRAGEGIVEMVNRRTKESEEVEILEVAERLRRLWQAS
jgi:prolyl-tRNA synthetase